MPSRRKGLLRPNACSRSTAASGKHWPLAGHGAVAPASIIAGGVRSSLVRLIRGVLTGLLVSGGLAYSQTPPDLGRHLGDIEGTFVLLNAATGEYVRHNPARAAARFPPCSTFKVPNTAILLETGAAPDPAFTLKYDPALEQPENWARDFDLRGRVQGVCPLVLPGDGAAGRDGGPTTLRRGLSIRKSRHQRRRPSHRRSILG